MKFSKKALSTLGIILTIAALLVSAGMANAAEKKVKWKLAMTWGTNLPPFTDGVANMAKMVETMSDGNFVIRIDSSNKHKSPFGVLDLVKLGQYDMGHSA
ncbi:MAG: hypothetical protein KAJ25_13585 [Desulfobacula sp.]|nr:hypothetical protein [Desulfobacula sp.]